MKQKWWHDAAVYQIYPRSFYDTNGDGIGDLQGIIQKLEYLKTLGIDILWISPFFKSPNVDNGYDISDYRDIMDDFGTMADMEQLLAEAGRQGIRVVMDLVANHCSDQHAWFVEARRDKNSPYRDYFIWRDPVEGHEPNDIPCGFGGNAWQLDGMTGQYYLHLFAPQQPDLNWKNPKVRREIYDMMNFWIDKGISGFRMDVIELIGKEPDRGITANGAMLHPYLQEMNRETFGDKDLFTVGECWNVSEEVALQYTGGGELDMVFQFDHLCLDQQPGGEKWDMAPLRLPALKAVFAKWQRVFADRGWYTLVWDNHDLPRIVSRYGDEGKYRVESAKMLALCLHGMKGTPFIYQGEELGMTNIRLPSIEQYNDIESRNFYAERVAKGADPQKTLESVWAKGRDNARTPMQWSAGPNAGFTTGTPWLPVNGNYPTINAEDELADENSVFHFYQKLIALRKAAGIGEVLIYGSFTLLLPDDADIFAYRRAGKGRELLVVCNFHDITRADAPLPAENARLVLSNYPDDAGAALRPYEAKLYYIDQPV